MPIRNNEELFNVYTYRSEDTKIKVLPIVCRGGTEWTIRTFRDGQQGPVWEGQRLTKGTIAEYDLPDIPDDKVDEINESVQWANKFLEYDTNFNRKKRGTAPLSELYKMTSGGSLVERISDQL